MRIAVSANGADLGAPASPVFGRCPVYVFVDTETMAAEAMENPAVSTAGGAGIQAAEFVVEQGAQAVVTGNVGPNAYNVLQAAGVAVYLFEAGTVAQAVDALRAGRLREAGGATGPQHAGLARAGALVAAPRCARLRALRRQRVRAIARWRPCRRRSWRCGGSWPTSWSGSSSWRRRGEKPDASSRLCG